VEWSPNLIVWYLDGQEYHRVTPDSLGGRPWRFDYPYFLILNVAVGGNFGGPVGPETTFPQTMLVDYVRVYEYRP
jgi:beta-glucanase (GH16 family)